MAKADLMAWVRRKTPPLWAGDDSTRPNAQHPTFLTDYNRFNACTNATEVRAALMARVPPLTLKDVEEGLAEYNK